VATARVHEQRPIVSSGHPLSLCGRLLWKEWREDWLPLAIGVGLPLLSRPLWDRFDGSPFLVLNFLVICLTMLWAVYRTQNSVTGANARTALPMPGVPRWLFAIAVPLIVPASIGLIFGGLIRTWPAFGEMAGLGMMPAFTLYLMAGYAICTVATSAFTAFPAVLIGAGWMILTNPFEINHLEEKSLLCVLVVAGALLAQAVWEILAAQRIFFAGRLAIALALILLALFPLGMAQSFHREEVGGEWRFTPYPYISGTYQASVDQFHSKGPSGLLYHPKPSVRMNDLIHGFDSFAQPLGFRDATHVLVGQQKPGEEKLHLLEWDVAADTVREIIAFRTGRYALYRWHSELSPDGRYLFFYTDSSPASVIRKIPIGFDLWVVDLNTPRAGVAATGMMANQAYIGPSGTTIMQPFQAGRCYVKDKDRIVEINLATLQSRAMKAREAKR